MRKNGINRELRPIEGGICAPEGYSASAISCGIKDGDEPDFMMIASARRCAVGFVGATGKNVGAPVKVTKKNMRMGYARAMIANGGVANALRADGEKLAYRVCDAFFFHGLERTEIVLASTGKIGKEFPVELLEKSAKRLLDGLTSSSVASENAARAIQAEDSEGKQLSFAFDLGDYPCKIGVIFKGGRQTSPNMATFLAFLTTDVNISTPTLQKALQAEVRETLNLLNLGGVPSPNDCVCIFANGRAGNYKIDCADSEYKKFTHALRATLIEVCKATAREGGKQIFTCRVSGAISKEVARSVAKAIVGAPSVKEGLRKRKLDSQSVLYTALSEGNALKTECLRLRLSSSKGEIISYEEGEALPVGESMLDKLLSTEEIELNLELREGNYQATAYGNL